ncbi:MAG TPA: hypothetical protein VK419_04600, partial [Bryobacteraceae bacterium]|nr:hypothetical protein [Bryobacteraceae bacterium]
VKLDSARENVERTSESTLIIARSGESVVIYLHAQPIGAARLRDCAIWRFFCSPIEGSIRGTRRTRAV